jgi:hypothetical protein
MVEKKKNQKNKEEKKKEKEEKKRVEFFWNLKKGWTNERKKNPPHGLVWFGLG